jgi:hypothetical protein
LKFIETDGVVFLAGDVYTQQGASIPAGSAVFTVGGLDLNGNPVAEGGFLTFNSDLSVSGGSEDSNDGGTIFSQLSFTGTYSALAGGRSVLSLAGLSPAPTFAIYPSSGGMLMLEIDASGLSSGAALAQTATSFSTSGGYGFNLSAFNSSGVEVDDIAAFTATGGNFSGTLDENDEGTTHAGQSLSGTYADTGGGRGTMTLTDSTSGTMNFDYYVASSSSVLLIETDSVQVGTGTFLGQSAVGNSAAAMVHAAMARPKAGFHPALKKKVTIGK